MRRLNQKQKFENIGVLSLGDLELLSSFENLTMLKIALEISTSVAEYTLTRKPGQPVTKRGAIKKLLAKASQQGIKRNLSEDFNRAAILFGLVTKRTMAKKEL